jgi:hypothetical protein
MFKIQSRQVNAAGTRREWKDLRHATPFQTENDAQAYIERVFLDDPQSDLDAADFRIRSTE